MNFDVSAVQRKGRKFRYINNLDLQFFFGSAEDSFVNTSAKTLIDGVPFSEVFGHSAPFTTVFGDVLKGAEEGKVIYRNIAALFRKQMPDTRILFVCPSHDGQ